jgi:RNA polymerase sigma-70 factor (ECF subfamily)
LDTFDWTVVSQDCLRVARRHSGDADEAEDIAQEALLRAWRHQQTGRAVANPAAWLAQITRNEAARLFARKRPELSASTAEEIVDHDPWLAAANSRMDVASAVSELETLDRVLVWLRYTEDLTQPAIARLVGLPEGTVKVRLHRARRRLRQALEPG